MSLHYFEEQVELIIRTVSTCRRCDAGEVEVDEDDSVDEVALEDDVPLILLRLLESRWPVISTSCPTCCFNSLDFPSRMYIEELVVEVLLFIEPVVEPVVPDVPDVALDDDEP